MGMDFRDLVRKWVWKITFFGLKLGQDLKNQVAHPHQEFPGEPSRSPYPVKHIHSDSFSFLCVPYTWF